MATIVDIAKASGYSVSTVSYALHDAKNISQATKDKIIAVAKQLKYYPNAAARNLKIKKTNNIGLFISGFEGPVYHKIYEGIAHVINESKYNLIISFSQNAKKMISERQIDAAIILCPKVSDKVIEMADYLNIPMFVLDRWNTGENSTYSHVVDSRSGGIIASKHLLEQGYERIAYLSGIKGSTVSDERYEGYQAVLSSANKDCTSWVYEGDFTEKSGYQLVESMMGKLPFDAIFCANDEMAIGFINACQAHGLNIPKDVAVIGFDNVEVAKYIAGGLSTISLDQISWGKEVANDLLSVLQGKVVDKQKVVRVELIKRQST